MDNFYQNCPAKMDDGRFTTNYRSDSCINEQIKYVNGITRDDDYRLFLQVVNKLLHSRNDWNTH